MLIITRTSLLRLYFVTPEYVYHTRLQNVHLMLCNLALNLFTCMAFLTERE